MIVDHRVYTMKANRANDFLELYEKIGLPLQREHLGEPIGFFQTHIGELGRLVHLWKYESIAEREARRAAMESDPRWSAYRERVIEADAVLDMRNQILKPVSFFKLK